MQIGISEKQINPKIKGAANTCPTVLSLFKNLRKPCAFTALVPFKEKPPYAGPAGIAVHCLLKHSTLKNVTFKLEIAIHTAANGNFRIHILLLTFYLTIDN